MDELNNQNQENKYLKIITVLKAIIVPFAGFFAFLTLNNIVQISFSVVLADLLADESLTQKENLEIITAAFEKNISLIYIIVSALFLVVYVIMQKKSKFSSAIDFEYKVPTKQIAVLSVFLGNFVGIASNIGLDILKNKLPVSWIERNKESVGAFQKGNIFLMLIAVGLCAPIIEELLFRGLIYNAIKKIIKTLTCKQTKATKYFTVITAAVVTSFLFGIYHGNILQAIYSGVLSLFMVYVYEKSSSIIASVIVHSLFNLSGISATIMSVFFGKFETLIISIVIVCLSVTMIYIVSRANRQEIQNGEN